MILAFFTRIKLFFEHLNTKQFKQYLGLFFFLLILIGGFIIYRYYKNINMLKTRALFINRKRKEVKDILERYEMVKKQQAEVDAMLNQDRDFKIAGFFNDTITKLSLSQYKSREPETSREVLDNGYTEVKLYASFANVSTQQVVELLQLIEQNQRIYTKELEMYKPSTNKTININILLATLEPKVQEEPSETE